MLNILVETTTPRMLYVFDLIFSQLLRLPHKILETENPNFEPTEFCVNYTEINRGNCLHVKPTYLLHEKNIGTERLGQMYGEIERAKEILSQPIKKDNIFPYDIFSCAFFLVAAYDKYLSTDFDAYGRYKETYKWSVPIVQQWCAQLASCLPTHMQAEIERNKQWGVSFTWDIDNPWKHQHKGLARQSGAWVKSLRNLTLFRERWRTLIWKQQDPNDTYEEIMRLCPPKQTIFFMLVGIQLPQDSKFGLQHPQFRHLIKTLHEKDYKIGIHPSFGSFLSAQTIQTETQQLSDCIGEAISDSRQHFLRYRLPHTFRHLLEAGIRHDYTLCYPDAMGFPCGMGQPFLWYDLEREACTELWLHPTMLMDRTLVSFMQKDKESLWQDFLGLLEASKKQGGELCLLFHNEALSESGEWLGWGDFFREMIARCRE